MESGDNEFVNFTLPTYKAFLEARSHAIGCPQTHSFHEIAIFWSAKKRRKDTFPPPSIPFTRLFLQLQQPWWHLYCFAILGSTSIVTHSVKQHLLRNRPGSDAATSRDFLHESLQRAFTCANQLHWTAQYPPIMFILIHSFRLTTKIYLYTQPLVLRDYYLSGYVCGQLRRYHGCVNHLKYLYLGRGITVQTCLQWAVKNSKKMLL